MNRFMTREVKVGDIPMGIDYPVRIQSMTSLPTLDTQGVVEQVIRLIRIGCDYVRLATRNIREAENLLTIKKELKERGFRVPLIADVHFNPTVAEAAARIVEKVRINPGNYIPDDDDWINIPDEMVYERIRNRFLPLIRVCKEYGTALRIGSNHGSLSRRIVNKYGDTPLGMVASALEFIRICRQENFHNLVISMKSSNTRIMVYSNRLLVRQMIEEGMDYPIHLGVTEAGEGEDGRIKSAIGIGTLLAEGIGDTIRVSLTEDPVEEIPVARGILQGISQQSAISGQRSAVSARRLAEGYPVDFHRRETLQVGEVGGGKVPVVANVESLPQTTVAVQVDQLTEEMIRLINKNPQQVIIAESKGAGGLDEFRDMFRKLDDLHCQAPVIMKMMYPPMEPQTLLINSAIDLGALLIDGFGDGIWIDAEGQNRSFIDQLSYGILQGSRCRFTKTEFIACPSCGRTLFNIQDTLRLIRERMGHLKNLKIAVMGCIVNGPGEMADADYGYVGAGKGKVNLYKGKTMIGTNIAEKNALLALEQLIRKNGDWKS